jgi:hypothetical protein
MNQSLFFRSANQSPRRSGSKRRATHTPLEWFCQFHKANFEEHYWLALQGDYQAQLNVAFCFHGGAMTTTSFSIRWPCYGVVRTDDIAMCAWYLVAASSGHPRSASAAEQYGYVYECDKKPLYERQAILGTASALFLRIYHRPMPVAR